MAVTNERAPMPTSNATNAYELLGDIVDIILAEPKRYNQWITLITADGEFHDLSWAREDPDPDDMPACGTVGCVAGWTVMLKGNMERVRNYTPSILVEARGVLGIDTFQGAELFGETRAGTRQDSPQAHAERGAAHIRDFMAKYEAQLKEKEV